jgi:hypothetical protein
MRIAAFLLLIVNLQVFGQVTYKMAQVSVRRYHPGVSTYFDDFSGIV